MKRATPQSKPFAGDDFVLEARVLHVRPQPVRTLRMPHRYRLHQLHQVLQIAFGWHGTARHSFTIGKRSYASEDDYDHVLDIRDWESERQWSGDDDMMASIDEKSVRLSEVLRERMRFTYYYEAGFDVAVSIEVSRVEPTSPNSRPLCVQGSHGAPSEDWKPPRAFDLEKVNRSLRRKFGEADKKVVSRVADPIPYDPAEGRPRLENYRLSALNLHEQMKVVLSIEPMTLEGIAERLTSVGIVLAHGVESLRKAWKRKPPIREKLDGRLELDPDHPDYWLTDSMLRASLCRLPVPSTPPETREGAGVDTRSRMRIDELTTPEPWPRTISGRSRVLLCLDASDGPQEVEHLRAILERLGVQPPLHPSSLSSGALTRLADGRLAIDPLHGDVVRSREMFRSWRGKVAESVRQEADQVARRARYEQKHRDALRERRAWFARLRKGIVHVVAREQDVAGCVLMLEGHEARRFPPGNRAALRQTLESLDLAIGFDPRRLYESVDADLEERRFVDVSPPFAVPGPILADVVADHVPYRPPVTPTAELEAYWREGRRDALMEALERDVHTLLEWYRLGVMRCKVRRWVDDQAENFRVAWNVGAEPPLDEVLYRAEKQAIPVRLELSSGLLAAEIAGRYAFTPTRHGVTPLNEIIYQGRWENGETGEVDLFDIVRFTPPPELFEVLPTSLLI